MKIYIKNNGELTKDETNFNVSSLVNFYEDKNKFSIDWLRYDIRRLLSTNHKLIRLNEILKNNKILVNHNSKINIRELKKEDSGLILKFMKTPKVYEILEIKLFFNISEEKVSMILDELNTIMTLDLLEGIRYWCGCLIKDANLY
jgi:hypothetical protein